MNKEEFYNYNNPENSLYLPGCWLVKQRLGHITHALIAPRIPVNAPSDRPHEDPFSLSYCLPHSFLKHPPFYCIIL